MNPKIKGVIVPPITPFNAQGQVDSAAIKRLVDFLIERGIHGLFPGGTTGEGPLLSISERRQLAETFVAAADGRVPVIIHTGAITTGDTIDLTRHAQAIGAQAAAIRELKEETGIGNLRLCPLLLAGDPGRDPRGWTISVAYLAFLSEPQFAAQRPRAGMPRYFMMDASTIA